MSHQEIVSRGNQTPYKHAGTEDIEKVQAPHRLRDAIGNRSVANLNGIDGVGMDQLFDFPVALTIEQQESHGFNPSAGRAHTAAEKTGA